MLTYLDSVQHALDYLGTTHPGDSVLRDSKRAVLAAYSEIASAKRWNYLLSPLRIQTRGVFTGDGPTVGLQYQATAGSAPRLATLSGATWPSWAAGAWIRVEDVQYRVLSRLSDTQVQLHPLFRPDADLPAGTAFSLLLDTYLLPEDFLGLHDGYGEAGRPGAQFVDPAHWLRATRSMLAVSNPTMYTVIGDDVYPGRMTLKVAPNPEADRTLDFLYWRTPHPLGRVYEEKAGRVMASAGSDVISGTGTAFDSRMVGSILRIGLDPQHDPTGPSGDFPADFEAIVTEVPSGTSLTTDRSADLSGTNLRYVISDRVDINEVSMSNLWLRAIEKHIAINRVLKDRPSAQAQYARELQNARDTDAPSFGRRVIGQAPRPLHWSALKGDTSVFSQET